MDSRKLKKRKKWLYNQNPYCPNCGTKMILPEKGEGKFKHKNNEATIEHLNNKYHLKERRKPQLSEEGRKSCETRKGRTILLCRECNEALANEETKKLPLEELHERSGRGRRAVKEEAEKMILK